MDVLRQWAVCLIAAAAAGTFAMIISPRGSMDKTLRAVVGIFVVAAICSPLAELKDADFSVDAFADYGSEEVNADELREYMIDVCRNTIETQIASTAGELGVRVASVEAEISADSDNCIIIHNISVKVLEASASVIIDLSDKLQENLGVAVTVNAE